MNSEVDDMLNHTYPYLQDLDPSDHLTCILSAPCIRTSGSNILFQFWSKFDYVMLNKNWQINCNLIYHDLRVYDTMTIPQKMNNNYLINP